MKRTTRDDLARATSRAACFSIGMCKEVMVAFFKELADLAKQGRTIEIREFGTFYVKTRKPRPARNPQTGVVVMLPKRRVFLCKLSPITARKIMILEPITESLEALK